eukprot:760110-Rhodomonas_salina.1
MAAAGVWMSIRVVPRIPLRVWALVNRITGHKSPVRARACVLGLARHVLPHAVTCSSPTGTCKHPPHASVTCPTTITITITLTIAATRRSRQAVAHWQNSLTPAWPGLGVGLCSLALALSLRPRLRDRGRL